MDLLPVAAAGVAAALCAVVVRQRAPEIALALALAACVVLLWHTLPLLETIKDVLDELADLAQVSPQLLRPMLQTVGLALVTKLASALCKDAGEGSLAAFVEVAGSAAAVAVLQAMTSSLIRRPMSLAAA